MNAFGNITCSVMLSRHRALGFKTTRLSAERLDRARRVFVWSGAIVAACLMHAFVQFVVRA